MNRDLVEKNKIFECIAGSHSYGTNIETSDIDTRGIFIAPPEYIVSCINTVEQVEEKASDTVIYELQKFLHLAKDGNPNIIELLFTDQENIKFILPPFQKIRDNAHLFLSKKIRHTFSGYAISQLHRIKGHKKWINNPQEKEPPLLSNHCTIMDEHGHISKDGQWIREFLRNKFLVQTFGKAVFRVYTDPHGSFMPGCFNEDDNDLRYIDIKEEKLQERNPIYKGVLTVNFDEFKQALNEWKQYWEWKNNRNPQRGVLEEHFGYDSKHALHLVRLIRMCKEILTEGKVIVKRPDAKELLEIRNGKFSYDELIKWSEDADAELGEIYKTCKLPFAANVVAIDNLYREVTFNWWKEKGLV